MAKKASKKAAKKAAKKAPPKKKGGKAQTSAQPSLPTLEPPAPAKPAWRKVTRQEYLKCPFSEMERDQYSKELARTITAYSILEDEKKEQAKRIGAQIDAIKGRQKELSGYINNGYEERHVDCEWFFETSGVDPVTKLMIHHPEYKTLLRLDTKEVVQIVRIPESDYNMYQELPLKVEEKKPEEVKLSEGGPPPSNVVPITPPPGESPAGPKAGATPEADEDAGRIGSVDEEAEDLDQREPESEEEHESEEQK